MLNDPENDDNIELVPTVAGDSACLLPSIATKATNGAKVQLYDCSKETLVSCFNLR